MVTFLHGPLGLLNTDPVSWARSVTSRDYGHVPISQRKGIAMRNSRAFLNTIFLLIIVVIFVQCKSTGELLDLPSEATNSGNIFDHAIQVAQSIGSVDERAEAYAFIALVQVKAGQVAEAKHNIQIAIEAVGGRRVDQQNRVFRLVAAAQALVFRSKQMIPIGQV